MSFKEKQFQVDEWISQFDPAYWTPLSIMAQIAEESGEIATILNNMYGGRVKKSSDSDSKLENEICDILFALICLANSHNINLDEAWDKTIGARCERDKNRYNKKENL